ncbi:MAG: DUF5615 family PIN-like protein [Gemmataceae bacterium]
MNLYLDDNSNKTSLVGRLRAAGHKVAVPADLNLAGAADPKHLAACARTALVILTRDHEDFLDLHDLIQETHGRQAGIFVVRSDNDLSRDMSDRDIVRALANVEAAKAPVENNYVILNHWR